MHNIFDTQTTREKKLACKLHFSTKMYRCGYAATDITADGNPVELVKSFVYLGSVQSTKSQCLPDTRRRIAPVSSLMASLAEIGRDRPLSLPIKIWSKHTRHLFSPPFSTQQRHGPYVIKMTGSLRVLIGHMNC